MDGVATTRGELGKTVGVRQFFTLSFGTIIGVGWVIYLGFWLEPSGPLGAIVGFAGGTILVALIGLCYAEMATLYPVSGGEIAYTYANYGLLVSFITGWLLAVVYTSVASWEAISLALIAQHLVPGLQGRPLYEFAGETVHLGELIIGLAFMAAFVGLNYRGAKWAARAQEYLMYVFFAMCLVFIGAALVLGDVANLQPMFRRSATGSVWPAIVATFITAPYFLAGFDTIPQIMEEKSPGTPVRQAALMIVTGIVAAGIFYCVVILASSMVMPWERLVDMGELPAAAAFESALNSPFLAKVVIGAALIGILTTWNAVFIAASRIVFALARARMIPPTFSAVHPAFGSPTSAILLVGVAGGLGVLVGQGGIGPIVNMATMGFAIVFSLVCIGVIRLRITLPDASRPYRVPGGMIVIGMATLGALSFLVLTMRDLWLNAEGFPLEWIILLVGLAVGLLLWLAGAGPRATVSEPDRRALIFGTDLRE